MASMNEAVAGLLREYAGLLAITGGDPFRARSPSRKRGPGSAQPLSGRPLLSRLKCLRCGSPMYRIRTGRKNQPRQSYYHCSGTTTERKGCGNMVHVPALDRIIVDRVFMTSEDPHQEKEWLPGEDWTAELTDIEQQLAELPRKFRPGSAEFRARQEELLAEYEDYDSRPVSRGGWKRHQVLNPDGSVQTEGEYFATLDAEMQREYLKTLDIRVLKVDDLPGVPRAVRVVIDGIDHGTFPYPPPKTFRDATVA